ncbi:hypothetical protein ACQP1G_06815 [Nocardia sp. CA-107356]|uniref:hypothetical protein n=1 Tax=Nocardia sp. CA-107356 TaxID=3239972 RepID=UPI003D8B1FD5
MSTGPWSVGGLSLNGTHESLRRRPAALNSLTAAQHAVPIALCRPRVTDGFAAGWPWRSITGVTTSWLASVD